MTDPRPAAEPWIPRTKLVMPEPVRGAVVDPSLVAQLADLPTPLTLITAQAGSGKTTLAATVAGAARHATPAWISLDRGDDDLGVVLHLLAMALDPVVPGGCPSLRNLLSAGLPGAADARRAVGVLVNDVLAAGADPVLLVLDDLHVLTDDAALTVLGYLLDHAPAHLRVLGTARTEPRLGIVGAGLLAAAAPAITRPFHVVMPRVAAALTMVFAYGFVVGGVAFNLETILVAQGVPALSTLGVFPVIAASGVLGPLSLAAIGLSLVVSGSVRLAGAALMVTGVLFPVSRIGDIAVVAVTVDSLLFLGMTVLARALVIAPRPTSAPAPVEQRLAA